MGFQRIVLAFAAAFLFALPLSGQIDFTKYFDESSIPLLDPNDHLDPSFEWNMPGNVQVFLNEGINYLNEGDLPLAISNFDEVLKLDSLSWIAHYYRGICNKSRHNFEAAEKDLAASILLNARQAASHVELGEIYHLQNAFNKAAAAYEKAIDLDPKMTQAYYNLGSLSITKGDVKKGIKYYEKCNEVDPRFPQAYMMQGLLKFKARKKDNESILLFNKAVDADSTYALTYFWRGLACIALDRPDQGLSNWTKLVQLAPGNSFYTIMRGFLFIEMGDFDNAFNDLRKAMKSVAVDDEKFVGGQTVLDKKIDLQFAANYLITNGYGLNEKSFTLLKKGYCLLLAGKLKGAIEEIKKAEQIQPSATVYFLEALAYEHSGNHNDAFKYYTKTLEKDIDNFDAHKKSSVYRIELRDWAGANEDFNHMFRLQPRSPTTYRLRGLAKSLRKDYRGSIDDLNSFIKTDSSDYESIRTRSVCLSLIGDKAESNEDLRRLLYLQGQPELYVTVANNYLNLKDTTSAIEIWREYSAYRPKSSIPHMALAWIYVQQKKWDSVRLEIRILLPLVRPDNQSKEYSKIVFWDGLIDFQQSSYETAIAKFSKSLKSDSNNLDAKYFRAKAYEKVGEVKKALLELKELKNSGYADSASLYDVVAQRHR
jgi:tetratricopeptide (TPR) repeat protein